MPLPLSVIRKRARPSDALASPTPPPPPTTANKCASCSPTAAICVWGQCFCRPGATIEECMASTSDVEGESSLRAALPLWTPKTPALPQYLPSGVVHPDTAAGTAALEDEAERLAAAHALRSDRARRPIAATGDVGEFVVASKVGRGGRRTAREATQRESRPRGWTLSVRRPGSGDGLKTEREATLAAIRSRRAHAASVLRDGNAAASRNPGALRSGEAVQPYVSEVQAEKVSGGSIARGANAAYRWKHRAEAGAAAAVPLAAYRRDRSGKVVTRAEEVTQTTERAWRSAGARSNPRRRLQSAAASESSGAAAAGVLCSATDAGACSGRGICQRERCFCVGGWSGAACELRRRLLPSARGRGFVCTMSAHVAAISMRGECVCIPGWGGRRCGVRDAAGSDRNASRRAESQSSFCAKGGFDCGEQGLCRDGHCWCRAGWTGPRCLLDVSEVGGVAPRRLGAMRSLVVSISSHLILVVCFASFVGGLIVSLAMLWWRAER